ncbi:MAG: GIY-YIG nuclease family protein [Actinobacteria bacterium]|nr:GIY-YIG nuclease family protein [Actinomycetota bacterium]
MEGLPRSGIYVLVVQVSGNEIVTAGALGDLEMGEGYYAYVGRAKRGLPARLARHARGQDKRLHWHIDYLLERAWLREIWVFPLRVGECELALILEREGGSREGLRGFGSSDCRCAGHLLYMGKEKPLPPRDTVTVVRGLGSPCL